MIEILVSIIGYMAVGCLLGCAVALTFCWLKNKIREKLAAKNAKKVAVADLKKIIEETKNTVKFDDLKEISDEGYTHLVATVDNSGQVNDVEVIEDTSDIIDEEVDQFINRTGEGIVVISR